MTKTYDLSEDQFTFECTDETSGVVFTPWTNGWAIGFKCTWPDGHIEFIYLNPSSGDLNPSSGDDGGEPNPDASPNVFVYQGTAGDPNEDVSLHFYDIDRSEQA